MTGRERILCTLAGGIPDRVPLVFGTTNATGIKMNAYRSLKKMLGFDAPDRYIYDWPELGTARVDEEILRLLGADVRSVLDLPSLASRQRNAARPLHSDYIDDWGTGNTEIEPGVWYPGIHPLRDATTEEEINAYSWPDMDDPSRVAHVRAEVESLAAEGESAIMGCPWLLFPFERAHAMQGLDRFLENLIIEPEFAQSLLWKIESLCKTLMGHFLDAAGDHLDIIKIGDDLGTQDGLMISPDMYRRILKPVHADFISFIKSRTKAKVFFHSDGDIYDLIPDFIEMGVDILNPIQSGAGKMAGLEELKRQYGKNIVFCGAIDTQKILPTGTRDEVIREVRRVMHILGRDGGFMAGAVHTVMNEVPPENLLAMCQTVQKDGQYPFRT